MTDHIDGPRTAGDPAIDLSDLFAFASPEDAGRMVFVACVFPFAGETGSFSNAANYAIVLRPLTVAGTGEQASFHPGAGEIRFTFQFDALKPGPSGAAPIQTGHCILPGGATLPFTVGGETGATTADGTVRVFAGLRSDPCFIGWIPAKELMKLPNILHEDNVLSIVVECATDAVLTPAGGPLFGIAAETSPRAADPIRGIVPRYDWVGRPEQTNFRLNGVPGAPDLRDLWNQQTPFAISPDAMPLFRKRLTESLAIWDMRDGKQDWDPPMRDALVNVLLDDFLIFDISKPITDTSHLEIEKATLSGTAHTTGGGRTLNANVIDILLTWLINRDTGPFWLGGATQATQPGGTVFPYVRPPNRTPLTIALDASLAAPPDPVWAVAGGFDTVWHPLIAAAKLIGSGVGQLRQGETTDGKVLIERLESIDPAARAMTYTVLSGLPVAHLDGTIAVTPKGTGSLVTWTVRYRPAGQADFIARQLLAGWMKAGLAGLTGRFGALP